MNNNMTWSGRRQGLKTLALMTLSLENTTKFGQRMPKKLSNSLGEIYGYVKGLTV